jgi:hypothetical protein
MKEKYSRARQSLIEEPWTRKDSYLNSFVKAEKVNPFAKPTKPRIINARDPRYNLELATYLKPLEHYLWRVLKGVCPGVARSRVVGKGLNSFERAELIVEKMEGMPNGVAFEVDGSAFEAHCTQESLTYEHRVYRSAYPGDENLNRLLERQLELVGCTAGGIKYRRKGCRASGDFNTGMGNTLICIATIETVMGELRREIPGLKYDMLVDGDNAVLFMPHEHVHQVRERFSAVCTLLTPQEMTLGAIAYTPEEVTFGQSHPVKVAGKWRMVREVYKVLSNTFSSHRHLEHRNFGLRFLKLVAHAEMLLNEGVPVLGPWFRKARAQLSWSKDLPEPRDYLEFHQLEVLNRMKEAVKDTPISAETRLSFARAFGISPDQQVRLEQTLVPDFSGFNGAQSTVIEDADFPGVLESSHLYLDGK